MPTADEASIDLFRQINKLAEQLAETQEQAQRTERLAKIGGDMEEWSQKSAQKQRRKSRVRAPANTCPCPWHMTQCTHICAFVFLQDLSQELGDLGDEMLEKAFKQFDQDGNGTLDADELSAALRAAGCETVDDAHLGKVMKLIDTNGDGLIQLDEFKEIGKKLSLLAAGVDVEVLDNDIKAAELADAAKAAAPAPAPDAAK